MLSNFVVRWFFIVAPDSGIVPAIDHCCSRPRRHYCLTKVTEYLRHVFVESKTCDYIMVLQSTANQWEILTFQRLHNKYYEYNGFLFEISKTLYIFFLHQSPEQHNFASEAIKWTDEVNENQENYQDNFQYNGNRSI